MDDNTKSDLLVDGVPPNSSSPNILQEAIQAISNLILPTNKELITLLRITTPIKVSRLFTVSAGGTIGGSYAMPDLSQIVWTSPMSAESWLHRITITSPEHGPASPLTSGQLGLVGSGSGEYILSLPVTTGWPIAPTQFVEGRLSAPHLAPGASLTISGDGLTAGNHIRIDLQISLVQGVSEFTPRTMSPTNLSQRSDGNVGFD